MAKVKRKKMSAGEAVKILANESKVTKSQLGILFNAITNIEHLVKDYIALFEQYVQYTKDGKGFIKKMEQLVKEKVDASKANEQTNEGNTNRDSQNKESRTERVRAQEG